MIAPVNAGTDNVVWVENSIQTIPASAAGNAVMITNGSDQDWKFTATVAVQAKPEVPDWTELEVGAIEPEVPEELVQQELDAVRATVAELVPVEGRPVGPEDTVIVDLVSPNGETRRDYVVELGRGAVVEEIEAGVPGMSAGETKEIAFEVADGSSQSVTVTVKEIKEKYAFVSDAAERMSHLISDLLEYSRTGRAESDERETVALDDAWDLAVANLQHAIAGAGATVERGELPVVRASAKYVRVAPRKARLIADQVRGLHIEKAAHCSPSRLAAPPRTSPS